MKIFYLKNFRKGYATNSSSTHSIIYKNKGDLLEDMNIIEEDYYDRYTKTIAASKSAKIKYIAANIYHYKALFEVISKIYPEMEEYRSFIKKQQESDNKPGNYENIFGMTYRGNLYFTESENFEASIDYLKFIIDNEDIVIVGGSDEEDFVYDTKSGHEHLPIPSQTRDEFGLFRNGNYWFSSSYDGSRARFKTEEGKCVPLYPELIDLKVTNQCDHMCPFCYMDASPDGKHADFNQLRLTINNLTKEYGYTRYKRKIEFAIGGGNILCYPDLEELFKLLKEKGHIINTTVKASDYKRITEEENFTKLFSEYVNGIGVSVCNDEDFEILTKLGVYNDWNTGKPHFNVTVHLIPEMLGVNKTRKYVVELRKYGFFYFLFLGYKTNGRGKNVNHKTFANDELTDLFYNIYCISIDTTFANRYRSWLEKNWNTEDTVTYTEGEYSMYIDGVENVAYKSSYDLSTPYPLTRPEINNNQTYLDVEKQRGKTWFMPIDAFKHIREDNGLETFKDYDVY